MPNWAPVLIGCMNPVIYNQNMLSKKHVVVLTLAYCHNFYAFSGQYNENWKNIAILLNVQGVWEKIL